MTRQPSSAARLPAVRPAMPAPTTARSYVVILTLDPYVGVSWLRQQHVDDHPDQFDIAHGQAVADHCGGRAGNRPKPLPAAERGPQARSQNREREAGGRELPPAHQEMQHRIVIHAVEAPSARSSWPDNLFEDGHRGWCDLERIRHDLL